MKIWRNVFMMLAAFSLASCGSDEPRYADPEAHEKTVLLNEQYGPLMVGTWHYEKIGERHRYFERLTFKDDGTLTGYRKWQQRELERHVHRDVAAEILESRGQQRREAQLPATDRHIRRRARLHGLLLRPHLRLCRRDHPPHPRLLRQSPRRLDQLPARRCRTEFLIITEREYEQANHHHHPARTRCNGGTGTNDEG